MNTRSLFLFLMFAALLAATGCGNSPPPTGKVSGKATLKGQPLTAGVVQFFCAEHGTGATAPLGPDGGFDVQEPVRTGKYVVFWSMPIPTSPMMPGDPPPPKGPANAPHRDINEQKSKVTVEVNTGPNTFNLDLE